MAGPTLVHDTRVTMDGVTHKGTYYVQGSLVYVQYGDARKNTQIGASPAESLARLLLTELVREELGLKAKSR